VVSVWILFEAYPKLNWRETWRETWREPVGLFEAYQAFGTTIGGETGSTDTVKHIA
jgi:hypothetical protein